MNAARYLQRGTHYLTDFVSPDIGDDAGLQYGNIQESGDGDDDDDFEEDTENPSHADDEEDDTGIGIQRTTEKLFVQGGAFHYRRND